MYRFSLPDSSCVRMENKVLFYALQTHKEWFYDDFEIGCVYGCPGGCIWNGGRIIGGEEGISPREFVDAVVGMYAGWGIAYRLVFINCLLEHKHLYDTYGNKLAELMNFDTVSAMVSLSLMARYLQDRYSHIKICWSMTTEFGNDIDEQVRTVNRLSRDTLVVVPYWFNNFPNVLGRLKYPGNIEVLVNEECIDNCPKAREHWRFGSEYVLLEANPRSEFLSYPCPMYREHEALFQNRFHRIGRDKLKNYEQLGFTSFKFEGRGTPQKILQAVTDYFLLPGRAGDYVKFREKCMVSNFAGLKGSGNTEVVK